jgi:hypothetical protein
VVTFQLHGTATQVAMVLVSFMAPLAIASPLAGVFVDRWHLKRTIIASDLIRGVLVLGLVFVHDLYVIYAILFTMSVVSADGIDRGGNVRVGPVRIGNFHHGDDADPARNTARTIGASDELLDVAGGGVAGDLDVRGWSGGGKDWDSEPLLWKCCDAGRNRRGRILQAADGQDG